MAKERCLNDNLTSLRPPEFYADYELLANLKISSHVP